MIAKRVIGTLQFESGSPQDPSDPHTQHWVSQLRLLEDHGADEIALDLRPIANGAAIQLLGSLLSEASVPLIMMGVGKPATAHAALSAGVDKIAVCAANGNGFGWVSSIVDRWGPHAVVASVELDDQLDQRCQAATSIGIGELMVCAKAPSTADAPSRIIDIADRYPMPVLACVEDASLEQMRTLLEGSASGLVIGSKSRGARSLSEVKRYLTAAGIIVRGLS